eukprot:6200057-Pleurochrysis_carterae.AAC.1
MQPHCHGGWRGQSEPVRVSRRTRRGPPFRPPVAAALPPLLSRGPLLPRLVPVLLPVSPVLRPQHSPFRPNRRLPCASVAASAVCAMPRLRRPAPPLRTCL